jgi:hypothetical protein
VAGTFKAAIVFELGINAIDCRKTAHPGRIPQGTALCQKVRLELSKKYSDPSFPMDSARASRIWNPHPGHLMHMVRIPRRGQKILRGRVAADEVPGHDGL